MHDAENGWKSRLVSRKIITYDHQDRSEENHLQLGEWEADGENCVFRKLWKEKFYNR